jgi:hypothetical protein
LANLMLIIFSNFRSSLGGLERDPKARLSSLHIFRWSSWRCVVLVSTISEKGSALVGKVLKFGCAT